MRNRISQVVLIAALLLVLVGSLLAQNVHTSMHTVDISRIYFDTERGTLSGLLYQPKDLTAPRPAVIVTHGYLNSAEMQDANAIELSRRGFVVLALDMYDHGHSKGNPDHTGGFFKFWPEALYDAAVWMYGQPYVLKDEAGNGMIGVTGHSMGGYSSTMAIYQDEQTFAQKGYRIIAAGLSEGSDFHWSGYLGVTAEAAAHNGGGRVMGKLCAQYDEFFFNADDAAPGEGTVRRKDFVSTADGKTWLEQEAPLPNTWYDTADGGRRIVYQPAETHPWNHFSTESTAHAVDFYQIAFAAQASLLKDIPSGNQIWLWKEIFECVALVGLLLLVVPLAMLVMKLPFFRQAKTVQAAPLAAPSTPGGKLGSWTALLVLILIPAMFFPALMDHKFGAEPMMILFDLGIVFALAGLVAMLLGRRADDRRHLLGAGAVTMLGGIALALLTSLPTYNNPAFWTAPSVNQIGYWTIVCATFIVISLGFSHGVSRGGVGATLAHYGIVLKPGVILAGLCTAVVTVLGVYAVIFLVDGVFLTDFRLWVFAFKTFDGNLLLTMLRYLPTFLCYYLLSSAAIMINTNTSGIQGIKGYLLAIALNCGGIILFLVRQYGTLFLTGVGAHPTQSLSSILLIAMVPTLTFAACFSRALYKRTGNIWTAAFLNGILVTMMTIANTCVYFR